MRKLSLILATVAVAGVAGCVTTPDMRNAAVGAVIGCVAGEIIQNGQCVTGAAIGGLGGALANDI
jgi:hypothetical protein